MKLYFGPVEATRPKLELARLVYVSSDRASSCEKTFEDLKVLKREHCQQLVQDGKARYPEFMLPDVREEYIVFDEDPELLIPVGLA
jgi:hypothetical protein